MVPGTFVIFLVYFPLYFLLSPLFLIFYFYFFLYLYSDFFIGFIYLVHVLPVLIKTFFFLTNLPIKSSLARGQAGP